MKRLNSKQYLQIVQNDFQKDGSIRAMRRISDRRNRPAELRLKTTFGSNQTVICAIRPIEIISLLKKTFAELIISRCGPVA